MDAELKITIYGIANMARGRAEASARAISNLKRRYPLLKNDIGTLYCRYLNRLGIDTVAMPS